MAKRNSTEKIVEDLLNKIFGTKDSHKDIAIELVPKYSSSRGSLLSVLSFLAYYKGEGKL